VKQDESIYFCEEVIATWVYKEKEVGKGVKGTYKGHLLWTANQLNEDVTPDLKQHHILHLTAQHTQYKKEKLKFIKNLKVTTKGNIKLLG